MPRRSAASLTTLRPSFDRPEPARLAIPGDLSPAERGEWCRVVDTLPGDYFEPAQAALLRQYVNLAVQGDRLRAALADLDPAQDVKQYAALTRLLVSVTTSTRNHATALRITTQARTRAEQAADLAERRPIDVTRAIERLTMRGHDA